MRGQNLEKVAVSDLVVAANRLKTRLTPTPLTSSQLLNIALGGEVFLKLESLQPTGSYKIRGAYNKCCHLKESLGEEGFHYHGIFRKSRTCMCLCCRKLLGMEAKNLCSRYNSADQEGQYQGVRCRPG